MKTEVYRQTEDFLKDVPFIKKRIEMLKRKIDFMQNAGVKNLTPLYLASGNGYQNPILKEGMGKNDYANLIKKEYAQRKMILTDLEQALSCLNKQERMTVEMFYFKAMSLDEIKEETCYSREHISRIKKNAVTKINKVLLGLSIHELSFKM